MKIKFKIERLKLLRIKPIILMIFIFVLNGCVERFEGFDETLSELEDVLVVEAIITNEFKQQEILLSRSFRIGEKQSNKETNAVVKVITSDGIEFIFNEVKKGVYLSQNEFSAENDKSYTLHILTEGGKSYISKDVKTPQGNASINDLYAERGINNEGSDGMEIFIDSNDPTGLSQFYRFEYEETYKIIAPYWSAYDVVVISEGELLTELGVILREREERLCYGTDTNREIILKNTSSLNEDILTRLPIRFVHSDNYILSYRYSILVKQFVQNAEAFSYYETLKGLSSSESLFSEDQPGFLIGNVVSVEDPSEHVAGYFEVAIVSEKRIFFNYEDFYPGEELPPYENPCIMSAPTSEGTLGTRPLFNAIYDGNIRYYARNSNREFGGGPFLLVPSECGDCTVLGSNKKPKFWID